MKPLARKAAAATLSVALVTAAIPRAAFAQPAPDDELNTAIKAAVAPTATTKATGAADNTTPAAGAHAAPPKVNAPAALAAMQQWGVFKGDDDVLKTYIGDANHLTPLGSALYLSLTKTHDPDSDKTALVDEVLGLQPTLDRLRQNGPYNAARQQSVDRTLQLFEKKFGKIDDAVDGSVEGEFERGALREALMTGAAVTDPPKQSDMIQVPIKDGYEFWDKTGLAYRINANNATTYNRELQKAQRAMNQSRPPEVQFIPETGRYNPEMFDYSYWRLKDQYDALVEGMRRDRVMALADLLGESGKYREDMWFTDKRIQADLEAEAKTKTYSHHGQDYNVLDLVNAKFKQRQYYLDGALKGVDRFKTDMDALKAGLKDNPVVGDAQVQNLSLDEQSTLRFLSLGVLETQSFYVKNQVERLDPASPDAEQVMTAIDKSDLTPEQKSNYKLRAQDMVNRLKALNGVLEKTRTTLSSSDYSGSLDLANAALTSSQRELGMIGADYSMFVEIPSVAFLGKEQGDVSWMNFGAKFTRWAYKAVRPGSDYTAAMKAINANQAKYGDVARLIADGKTAQARQAVIAMNPDAVKGSFSAALGGDPARITEMARLAASLKVNRDRIGTVFETNKTLDAVGTFITWTVDMAVAAPVMRMGCNGVGTMLARFTSESTPWLARRLAILGSETMLHTGARLQSLDPDAVWVNSQASNAVTRYMLATTMRAGSVAMRQAAFTGMSAGISGTFTLGQHLWDVGSEKIFAPGQSATVNVPLIGSIGIRPSDSMFNADFGGAVDAFWTGAKGGAWWANTPMEVGGVPVLLPGMLGYVGLPATVFRGTSLMRYAGFVGSRGVVGTGITGAKWIFSGGGAAAADGAVERGFLERLALKGAAGKGAAFTLGMADNVAKYAVFSDAVGWAGNQYAYHFEYRNEDDVERRIKGANTAGQKWLASPAWMLIPTYAAHPARDAALYQRGAQGAEQYKAAGLDHEIANSEEGARLRFLKTPEIPMAQRIFEASLKSPETGDYFIVTKEMRRDAIKSQMVSMLGGEKATPADIKPIDFYRATKMADGADFINLKVNDEVRLIAHQDFVESLLADPVRARSALDAKLGSNVEGFGRVTPEVQKDVAVALYSSEMQTGKPMPKELAGRVNEILAPYLEANQSVKPDAEGLIKALDAAPVKSEAFGAADAKEPGWALKDVMTKVAEWKQTRSSSPDHPYTELISELRATADQAKADGKLTAQEHAVLSKMYDYVDAIEKRFNAFNNVEKAHGLASESLGALKVQYEGNAGVTRILNDFSSALEKWAGAHGPADFVDGPRSDGSFKSMIRSLAQDLEKSKGSLSPADFASMKAALEDVGASPWVLHDSKGSALPSWRPVQFESFMGTLTAIAQQGRGGAPVRLFQMLKTGGGKTMLTFEGLLPLVEADAAGRKMQPMFLTVQSNLEAQARMEFIAYKKIGSNLKFDTYEGFKTKIAEGKTKGQNALRDYWILGDEMDGAALQPALTIGQVSGMIAKRSPVYNRVDELDTGLANRLTSDQSSRDTRVQTESRRAQNALARLDGAEGPGLIAEGAQLENAAGRLKDARGPESRRAALADVRDSAARVEKLLDAVPSREADAVATARQSLGRLKDALAKPSTNAAFRDGAIKELETGFARQENLLRLTGSEAGLSRLAVEAGTRGAELEGKISKLTADIAAARASNAPGASERAAALGDELALAKKELTIVDRFRSVDAGQRLANLQEKIAAANAEPGGAASVDLAGLEMPDPRAADRAEWKRKADAFADAQPDEVRPAVQAYVDALGRLDGLERDMRGLDSEIGAAVREKRPADELKARRTAAGAEVKAARAETARLKARLSEPQAASAKLAEWRRDASGYESSLPAEARPTAKAHADALGRIYDIGREMRDLDDQIADAAHDGRPADDLKARRAALESDYETVRSEAARLKTELASGSSTGDLGSMLRRLDVLKNQTSSAARSERAALLKKAQNEVRERLSASADDVVAQARDGKPGWEDGAVRLLERRRQMMEAFGGDENPMYTAFRDMKDDMQAIAMNKQLQSTDPAVYKPARDKLMKLVEGDGAISFLPKVPKLLWEVFTGRDVDIPIDKVGLTRLHAAKMLKALFADPTMPAHQRDNLFWSLTSSLLRPGNSRGVTEFESAAASARAESAKLSAALAAGASPADVAAMKSRVDALDAEAKRLDGRASAAKANSSWMRTELLRQLKGFGEKMSETTGLFSGIRLDGRTGKINVVHNGQWFESMDNETRRYWELEYGVDLTLPYTNQSISTIKDVTTDKKARFISFSGTAGEKLREHFENNGIKIEGEGSTAPPSVDMDIVVGQTSRLSRIGEAMAHANSDRGTVVVEGLEDASPAVREEIAKKAGGARVLKLSDFTDPGLSAARDWLTGLRERQGDADHVVVRRSDAVPSDAKPAIDAYLKAAKLAGKDDAVVRISEVTGADDASNQAAQKWLRTLRANQQETSLVVLSVSDTRVLKMVREYLTQVQGLKEDEIAMVFSDTEKLRNDVPEAKVAQQMNLDALNEGKARVLILDTRVGGRGLDLNFKGERGSLDPKAFRGYTNFEMLIVDPEKMSQVHLLQAEGRIDVDRVLPGTNRQFSLVMDVKSVEGETVFRDMIATDPFFSQLRSDPQFLAFEKTRGGKADWAAFHDYIRQRAADGSADGALLAEQYEDAVKTHLEIKQGNVEEDQLRSSSVLTDAPKNLGRYPGLEEMR